jgi:Sulfotransferase domain
MIYGLKFVAKYLLGLDQAERNFAVYPDDTFLVSYPRSGNTWTRFLIANLLHPEQQVTFANIERLIPDTSSQSNRALKRTPRPRFIKTHAYFDHKYGKVIYIVRDPRDVALSYYHFQRKYRQIEDDYSLEQYVDDYVSGRLISISWGTWGENVASWISTRGQSSRFLLLRYEDMIEDSEHELARVARFLELSAEPQLLLRAIERSSADRMREMEKLEANEWVATKKHRKDIPFVGAATSGKWKELLPESSVRSIEAAWGGLMASLGYELVAGFPHKRQPVLAAAMDRLP